MATEIAVNTETLQKDIDEMTSKLKSLKGVMEKSIDGINSLSGMWEGPAKTAFTEQFMTDSRKLEEQCKTIQSIIDCMEYAKKQYNLCENDVNGIINAINV